MSIHATLRYDDPTSAIDFLVTALGFSARQVHTADDGTVGHAELEFDGDVVMLGQRTTASTFDTGKAVVYLSLPEGESVDAHHDRAVAAGAQPVQELVDQPYGSREYAVADPEGNVWSVGTYRP